MTTSSNRDLKPTPEAEATFRRWITHLDEELTRHTTVDRRSEIVRDELFQIYLGRPHGGKLNTTLVSELASNTLYESFDPRNVTLTAEYDEGIDAEQYAIRKPLIYFWQMLDRSPLGANNWLGFRYRYMLGRHIFRKLGKGVKFFSDVEIGFGYNLEIGENCVIERYARLDANKEGALQDGTTVKAHSGINDTTHTQPNR